MHRYFLRVNGQKLKGHVRLDSTWQYSDNGSFVKILKLKAGDYVDVYYQADNGHSDYGTKEYNYFIGIKLKGVKDAND